jgi:hypothetical protein
MNVSQKVESRFAQKNNSSAGDGLMNFPILSRSIS